MATTSTHLRIRERLGRIYGDNADAAFSLLNDVINSHLKTSAELPPRQWSQEDITLITYGGQIRQPEKPPLESLNDFLVEHEYHELLNTVHILPFFPYSSDDGFSVIDYRQVDPALGDWGDVQRLGDSFTLAFDLVLNHCSSQSEWFHNYLKGESPGDGFFIEADPEVDHSQVTRPRSLPLLSEYETSRGKRHIWTTFSADQVDLNFANPAVLAEMIDILLEFTRKGARIVRLDAIAYLWKEEGTTCIHLPQTHEVVKLMHDVLELAAPGVWLLSETNVPHEDNISYFGEGDEADMVYQFSLPPLLLDALLSGETDSLAAWLRSLEPAPEGCTFFNFTASHDGIGVRPLEGLVPEERIHQLAQAVKKRGGRVNTRRKPDGTDSPYELNITYVDALGEEGMTAELHARRFLSSQAIMLSLQGIPGIYFHSLVGGQNDIAGMQESGQNRRINRKVVARNELETAISAEGSLQQRVYTGYRNLLHIRKSQRAFHPEAAQRVLPIENASVLAFVRTAVDDSQRIVVILNASADRQTVDLNSFLEACNAVNLITNVAIENVSNIELTAYETAWLEFSN